MTTVPGAPAGSAAATRDRRASARLIAAVVLAVVLTVFALLNSQSVRIHLVFTTARLPMIVVIAVCAVIGVIVGWLIGRRRAARGAWP
jgi:uncharacterized integral membrane protein